MIEFKKITLEDKPAIDEIFKQNPYRASECCFSNLYGWAHKFNTEFALWNGFLLIKFTNVIGGCSYLTPFGKGDLKSAIEVILEDCNCTERFEMSGVTQKMWEDIDAAMPGAFEKFPVRRTFDYIYTSEKLINLKGKKLQSKRNHINRFNRENDWKYVSLNDDPEMLQECKRMHKEWYEINAESHDDSLKHDYITTKDFLNNFEVLGLRGGAIVTENGMAAFSLGAKLTNDTFIVHVEKAFADVHGAYTIMNQQFAEHEGAAYTYINREEDMGFESLRKAKMSYRPDILLEKNYVKYKQP